MSQAALAKPESEQEVNPVVLRRMLTRSKREALQYNYDSTALEFAFRGLREAYWGAAMHGITDSRQREAFKAKMEQLMLRKQNSWRLYTQPACFKNWDF